MLKQGVFIIGFVLAFQSRQAPAEDLERATFAGGCFWCIESAFETLDGVVSAVSGYTGGSESNPSYDQVSSGATSHLEAVQVLFNPERIDYETLLGVFWHQIDPTDDGGQFADRGPQYRTAVFFHDRQQQRLATQSKRRLIKNGPFRASIMTAIRPATTFFEAEPYHQDYYRKNPNHYKAYRSASGRTAFLKRVWHRSVSPSAEETTSVSHRSFRKPPATVLKRMLSPLSFEVTQKNGTEPPFNNPYWNNQKPGIYVDIVSGEALFSSTDKFASGTGWPSFKKPLEPANIVVKTDTRHGMVRSEVRSARADSHLGHVFADGPAPQGKRYCINSAALEFVPQETLSARGLGKYLVLFR